MRLQPRHTRHANLYVVPVCPFLYISLARVNAKQSHRPNKVTVVTADLEKQESCQSFITRDGQGQTQALKASKHNSSVHPPRLSFTALPIHFVSVCVFIQHICIVCVGWGGHLMTNLTETYISWTNIHHRGLFNKNSSSPALGHRGV